MRSACVCACLWFIALLAFCMCSKERNSTCTLRTRSAFWEVSSSTFLRSCSTMAGFSREVPSAGESASRPRDCLDSNFSAPDATWTEKFHLICSRPFSSSSTHFCDRKCSWLTWEVQHVIWVLGVFRVTGHTAHLRCSQLSSSASSRSRSASTSLRRSLREFSCRTFWYLVITAIWQNHTNLKG